jgi:hypothetical protein
MRLTPKQAQTVASLIKDRPSEAVTFTADLGGSRTISVVFSGSDKFAVGGRGVAKKV